MAVTYIDGVLYIDNTIISTYATCPTKAMISYGLDRRRRSEDNANLVMGKAIHEALEYYFAGHSEGMCINVLKSNYQNWASENIFDNKRLEYQNIENVLRSWLTKNPREKLPFRVHPDNIEKSFAVPMVEDGSIIFTGRIDLLAHAKHGQTLFAIDNKCTGTLDARKKKEYSLTSQMTGYLWALQQEGIDIAGIYINAVHAGLVPTSNRKCQTHKTLYEECGFLHLNHEWLGPYQRSQTELEDWYADTLQFALEWKELLEFVDGDTDKLSSVQQRGKWIYQACNFCPWQDYCKSGRPKHWIEQETIIDPWRPGVLGDAN